MEQPNTEALTAAAPAIKAAAPVISKAIQSVGRALLTHGGPIAQSAVTKLLVDYQVGFGDYLTASFNRCQVVKTIVSGDKPVPLLDLYVHLNLRCANILAEDDELISDLKKYRHIVISGLAGTGKSMFMKYLTLCRFERPQGAIPLFVELRNLNDLTTKDLLQYVFHSCATASNKVDFERFELGLRSGAFLLILDGFDEIEHEHRNEIDRQIRDFCRRYPETTVIVSSRPDERFNAWQNFYVFSVEKLTIAQTIQLINNVEYNTGVKDRFIKEIKASLHKTHASFLSIPLLATIMLVTYGKFAEISPKIHLFYKLAFQTLYREHDAQKDQFKRDLYTGLALDDFEACFAAFCIASYLDQKFSFTKDQLDDYASRSIQHARQKVKVEDFIRDLKESVCMIQQDGLDFAFVHRSFQEYFSAVFAVAYYDDDIRHLLDRISQRENDATISMIFEMNRDKLEKEWVIPTVDEVISEISELLIRGNTALQFRYLFEAVRYERGRRQLMAFHLLDSRNSSRLSTLSRLYPSQRERIDFSPLFECFKLADVRKAVIQAGLEASPKFALLMADGETEEDILIDITPADDAWIASLGVDQVFQEISAGLASIKRQIATSNRGRGNLLQLAAPVAPKRRRKRS